VTESWYPIELEYRRVRRGAEGAGRYRGGAGAELAYGLSGSPVIHGTVFANRRRIPLPGMAGGYPGALTRLTIESPDGKVREIEDHAQGYALLPGETFVAQIASGGGYGDPVERDPTAVERDVVTGRLTLEEARTIYGVVIGDPQATQESRKALLAKRLADAEPALRPQGGTAGSDGATMLYPGVVQVNDLAVSERSGAILARAPDHWTDGCPRLRNLLPSAEGTHITGYLDPLTGHLLVVDVTARDVDRSFTTAPRRWTEAARESVLEFSK